MSQQTAVEWLIEQINNDAYQIAFGQTYVSIELVEQAKAMEKEQIIKAWWSGENDSSIDPKLIKDMAEQYYNEIYNK